jgi:hypothetical protein
MSFVCFAAGNAMAQKNVNGAVAPYNRTIPRNQNQPTTWCNGVAPPAQGGIVPAPAGAFVTPILGSTDFGSCVGLVMYCPSTHQGAVAHFPGSVNLVTAKADIQEILQDVCPAPVQNWKVWIFGGESLSGKSVHASAFIPGTQALIRLVRDDVWEHLAPQGGPDHLSPPTEPEMEANRYVAHKGVTLTLANGTLEWHALSGDTSKMVKPKRKMSAT